jgi:hypothetical protein
VSGRTEDAADHVECDVGLGRRTYWLDEAATANGLRFNESLEIWVSDRR